MKKVYASVLEEEKQAEAVIKERDALKKDNAKLNYRINILLRSLAAAESSHQ